MNWVPDTILGILLGLAPSVLLGLWKIYRQFAWLRAVIVPWMATISAAVNPEKK